MEHSFAVLTEEKEAIQNEINHLSTLINNHYKQIKRLKREQISYEIAKLEVNQTIDLIKYHNKII